MYVINQSTYIQPLADNDWRDWGTLFCRDPQFVLLGAPNPYNFTDWRDWAERLADALSNFGSTRSVGPFPNTRFIIAQTGDFLITQGNDFLVTQ